MLSKRIIPCLDVRDGKLTKGIKFQGNQDIGDPVETARRYYEEGADEIVFYDITASAEGRGIFLDVVERVAAEIFIPCSVGGGIASVSDMRAALLAGAEKVSVNSAAVKNPILLSEGADALSHLAKTWEEKRSVLSLFLHESSVEAVNAALAESLSFAETEKPDEAKASLRQVIIFLTELREREHPNLGNIF